MNAQMFQNDKFIPPALPEICAPRHDLMKAFRGAASKRIICISAPAGYGKTVSALLWLRETGCKNIWLSLDMYDNTPALFYKFFATALLSTQPNNSGLNAIVKNPAFISSPVEYTNMAISELHHIGEGYILVLDDLHLITNAEILKSLPFVLRRLPLFISVILLSRDGLLEIVADFFRSDRTYIIEADSLLFKSGEIKQYFSDCGLQISDREADTAQSATNGWPIAISALAVAGGVNVDSAKMHLFDNYMKANIWHKWGEDEREFLLKTSIVNEFTAELANLLTGRGDSQEMLRKLCLSNAFISHMGGVYRYHHLFLDFLRSLSEGDGELNRRLLYKTAGDYYFQNDLGYNALLFYIKSGNLESIIPAMEKLNEYGAYSNSVAEHLNSMRLIDFAALTEQVYTVRPYMILRCAWMCSLSGDAAQMYRYFDRFYEAVDSLCLKPESFVELAHECIYLDCRKTLKEHMLNMKELNLPKRGVRKNLLALTRNMPFIYRSHRDYSEYAADLENMVSLFLDSYGRIAGNFASVFKHQIQSEILYEKNQLKKALDFARASRERSETLEIAEYAFLSNMISATIHYAMGNESEMAMCIDQIEDLINTNNLEHLRPNLLSFKTRIRLLDGNQSAAKSWLDNYFITDQEHLELYKIYQHFTTARAYIVLGEVGKAMALITKLKALGTDFKRPLDVAEAMVLQSIVEHHTGGKNEALETLGAALLNMQEYGFIRVIADDGAAVLPILKKLLKANRGNLPDGLGRKYLREVLMAAYAQARRHNSIINASLMIKPVKLSKRQQAMINYLAHGHSNKEIAEITGLSINTVKTHIALAYQKLNVNNAFDAVTKAAEWKLID